MNEATTSEKKPVLSVNGKKARFGAIIIGIIGLSLFLHNAGFDRALSICFGAVLLITLGFGRSVALCLFCMFLTQSVMTVGEYSVPYFQSVHWDFLVVVVGYADKVGFFKFSLAMFSILITPLYVLRLGNFIIREKPKSPYDEISRMWVKNN